MGISLINKSAETQTRVGSVVRDSGWCVLVGELGERSSTKRCMTQNAYRYESKHYNLQLARPDNHNAQKLGI